jgi:hypothetical protein
VLSALWVVSSANVLVWWLWGPFQETYQVIAAYLVSIGYFAALVMNKRVKANVMFIDIAAKKDIGGLVFTGLISGLMSAASLLIFFFRPDRCFSTRCLVGEFMIGRKDEDYVYVLWSSFFFVIFAWGCLIQLFELMRRGLSRI